MANRITSIRIGGFLFRSGGLGRSGRRRGRAFSTSTDSAPSKSKPSYLRYIHRNDVAVAAESGNRKSGEGSASRDRGDAIAPLLALDTTTPKHIDDAAAAGDAVGKALENLPRGSVAGDVLRQKQLLRQQLHVPGNCTVDEAITMMVNQRVTSFLVVNRKREVIGMFTSRDVMGELARFPHKADGLGAKAHEFMIPINQMVYCSPEDSLQRCLLIMSELKIRNLPVVVEGEVAGIINVNDIADFSFSTSELGGKSSYIKNIAERKGLPRGVRPTSTHEEVRDEHISASVGAAALPHPFKGKDGVSASAREHRHLDICTDPTLSEDAHFTLSVSWPSAHSDTVHYVGVADGVGSWRAMGVDPRNFSNKLMHWAQQFVLSSAPSPGNAARPPPKPHEVLSAAWEMTIAEKAVGSSTACVASLDYELDQLTFSNIGDSGVVVLRHIDSDVAGYMRETQTPRHLRADDLRLAFISQQQLRSFNLPYQFGYTNVDKDNANFETPKDAVNTSFPVTPGDIIIIATDGLFDNMELDEVCDLALKWETKWFGGPSHGLETHNNAAMEDLSQTLAKRARDLSLDSSRDSPFALLAKENDIMWSGGMPDDVTIVTMRVTKKAKPVAERDEDDFP